VIDGDVSFLAPLFVDFVMLSKVLTTRGIPSLVEGLSLSIRLDEMVVKPGPTTILVSCTSTSIQNELTYLQILHQRPVSVTKLSADILNLTFTLSDIIVRRSSVESFLTGFACKLEP
jgi:hypothetical protein